MTNALALSKVFAGRRSYSFILFVVAINKTMFFDTLDRYSYFLFSILSNDAFFGNYITNAFLDRFLYFFSMPTSILSGSISDRFVFFKYTHSSLPTINRLYVLVKLDLNP